MIDVSGLLTKAADKCGYHRQKRDERRIPTDPANVCVIPFFGDFRSLFILSSLLLKRFREEVKPSKYVILCSWPGFQGLFPYVDEYWEIADEMALGKMYQCTSQFRNKSPLTHAYYRNLNHYFFEDVVVPHEAFTQYYQNGLVGGFWQAFKQVKRFLPLVPSTVMLGKDFNRELAARGGFKVFLAPTHTLNLWRMGDMEQVPVKREFWVTAVQTLLREKFVPVLYKGWFTHDLSPTFTDQCVYVADSDVSHVLTCMRATGLVLDIFGGLSRLALAARCPFVMVDERARYAALREYEIDDLCGPKVPRQYIFSFPTIIESGSPESWAYNILSGVVARLHSFMPDLDRDEWPSTGESTEVVPYESVRKKKLLRIGTRLLKVPNEE